MNNWLIEIGTFSEVHEILNSIVDTYLILGKTNSYPDSERIYWKFTL